MKNQRKCSQLKDQVNFSERTNNKTDLFRLIDMKFKKEIMKILRELRRASDRNADYCKKKLERRGSEKN